MNIEIHKQFTNGNKIIAVKREVVTYFRVFKEDGENLVSEMNTVDELKTKTWSGLSDEFWEEVDKL